MYVQMGTMNFSNSNEVIRQLEGGEKKILDFPNECNYTVTTDGRIWLTVGGEFSVDPSNIPSSLKGSYSYHNHPASVTHYSFSADDVAFFIETGSAYSKASDYQFKYTMRRTPNTIEMPSDELRSRFKEIKNTYVLELKWDEKIDPDLDSYHEVMKILSEELNFEYARESR